MKGIQLKFYMHENRKHNGILLYEWLIEKAKELGFHGGSVFCAFEGFGRHGVIHEEHFFELGANVPMEAIFILTEDECDRFLSALEGEKLNILYIKVPVEYGVTNSRTQSL